MHCSFWNVYIAQLMILIYQNSSSHVKTITEVGYVAMKVKAATGKRGDEFLRVTSHVV